MTTLGIRLLAVTLAGAAPSLAQKAEFIPTVDPMGAVTAVTLYGVDAEAGDGWNGGSRTVRAVEPGRTLKYHVIMPPSPQNWRLGLTVRSLGSTAGDVRFRLGLGDTALEPLYASPSSDEFGTYWSPLARFGGAATITITPDGDSGVFPGVEIGAIQLARVGEPAEWSSPAGTPDQTITGTTSGPRANKSGGGGGGGSSGGGGDPFEGVFPELDPPVDPPLVTNDPGPEPTPPAPPGPRRVPDGERPPALPGPGPAALFLIGGAALRARSRR